MTFIRRKEDFVCEHCGSAVQGSGYTNHCPHCLWSKHVDIDPGDRLEQCGGMMRPIDIMGSSPDYVIVHRCEKCKKERRISAAAIDEPEALLQLAKNKSISS